MALAAAKQGVCARSSPARPQQHLQARGSLTARPAWAANGRRSAAPPRAAASGGSAADPWTPPADPSKDPFAKKTVYKDNVFDRAMIWYFSSVMSKQLGGERGRARSAWLLPAQAYGGPRKDGRPQVQPFGTQPLSPQHATAATPLAGLPFSGSWDDFVQLSREIMKGRNSRQQQETVAGVLAGLLPPQAPERFRRWCARRCLGGAGRPPFVGRLSPPPHALSDQRLPLPLPLIRHHHRWWVHCIAFIPWRRFPLNKRNAEFNAFITVLGFAWLVGPSKLQEVRAGAGWLTRRLGRWIDARARRRTHGMGGWLLVRAATAWRRW